MTRRRLFSTGQLIETEKPDGARLVHAYDKTDLVTRVESFALGAGKPEYVTRYWYDGRGLLAKAENKAALVEYKRDKSPGGKEAPQNGDGHGNPGLGPVPVS